VIKASEHLSKAAFSEFAYDLKSVSDMAAFFGYILIFVIIEAIIIDSVRGGWRTILNFTFCKAEPVDDVIV
jgi:hypothetical protein